MKKSIWKFELRGFKNSLEVPKGGQILKLGIHLGVDCLWILVDPGEKPETRRFEFYGTGDLFVNDPGVYIDSITSLNENGLQVFHLFEQKGEC